MARKISHFQIGLFFLIGVAITLVILLWIGATHFFQPGKLYETFFSESVEGLTPGADVSYLGVQVGRVTAIGIAPDGKLIRVEMMLAPNFNASHKAVAINMKGIIGQVYLGIAVAPADIGKITPKITFPHKYPLIPSQPGQMHQVLAALDTIYRKIKTVDLKGLTQKWEMTAQTANDLLADKDIRETIRNLRELSGDIKQAAAILRQPEVRRKLRHDLDNLASTLAAARQSSESLASQLQGLPPRSVAEIARQMEQTMFQVNQVLLNLKGLVHELREEPGKVLVVPREKEPFRR